MHKRRNQPRCDNQRQPSRHRKIPSIRPERLIVRGTVSYADKSPAVGLTVIAFDKDVSGEDQLGERITDAKTRFEIAYSAAKFRRSSRERGGADVFARVYGANGGLLLQSRTVPNAPAKLRMDVQLPVRQGERLPDPPSPFAARSVSPTTRRWPACACGPTSPELWVISRAIAGSISREWVRSGGWSSLFQVQANGGRRHSRPSTKP